MPFALIAIAMCIAVGNTSFVDWDLLTWSFGWTGFLLPNFPPRISIALLAITSLTFIFVWVPDPVCQTLRGKWSLSFPDIISLAALIIALLIFLSRFLFFSFTIAAAFLIIAIDLMTIGLTKKSPMSKCLLDRSVEAPQYLLLGTLTVPKLSYSFLNFIYRGMISNIYIRLF